MRGRILRSLAVTVLGVLLTTSVGSTQGDRAKALLGKWQGAVQWEGGAGSRTGDPNRTLVIDSVDQKDGKWVASGRYGITGKGLGKVDIEVQESGASIGIRFVAGGNSTVRLSLSGARQLTGTLTVPGTSQRGNDRRFNLEKVD